MAEVGQIKRLWRRLLVGQCRHEWAPSRSTEGWVCVRCGMREAPHPSNPDVVLAASQAAKELGETPGPIGG